MGKQSGGGARTGFGIGRNAEGGQMGFAANISQRARLAQATTAAMRAGQTRIQRLPSTTEGDGLSSDKAIVTLEDEVEPDGITELEITNADAIALAFDTQLNESFPKDYEMNEEEFFAFFRRSFEANSSLLHDSLLIMMLGFAALGVAEQPKQVRQPCSTSDITSSSLALLILSQATMEARSDFPGSCADAHDC